MTAFTRHELVEEAKREGALAIFSKPLEIDQLLAVLGHVTRASGE